MPLLKLDLLGKLATQRSKASGKKKEFLFALLFPEHSLIVRPSREWNEGIQNKKTIWW